MTKPRDKNWHQSFHEKLTFGQRLADTVAAGIGSWKFIIVQTVFVILWMIMNVIGFLQKWDPYPFILLNLLFSTQAAYAAPIIMMSQNRQSHRDRSHAEVDYQVNLKSKEEIENIIIKLNSMELDKLDKILSILEQGNKIKTKNTLQKNGPQEGGC